MNILLLISILLHTSSQIQASRLSAVVHAAKGGPTVGAGVMTAFIQPDAIPSVADTSGDSPKGGTRQNEDVSSADRKARQSRIMGILALGSIGLAFLLPVVIAATIPLGILAIVKGSRAKKEGSSRPTGKAMGIVALSLILLGIVMLIVFTFTPGFF